MMAHRSMAAGVPASPPPSLLLPHKENTSLSLAIIPTNLPSQCLTTVINIAPIVSLGPHAKYKYVGNPLTPYRYSSKEKREGGGGWGPRLLVRNSNFVDVEFFDPYTCGIERQLHHRCNGRIVASNQNWLLMTSGNDLYFLDVVTSDVRQLPRLNQQYSNLAGAFTVPPLHLDSVIILMLENNSGYIDVRVHQYGQWRDYRIEYEDHGFNSLILYDSKVWWISDESKLYAAAINEVNQPIIQTFNLRSSTYSLVPRNEHLYLVEFMTDQSFSTYVQCYMIINTTTSLNVQALQNIGHYDIFVIPTQAGFSLSARTGSNGGRIFIGIHSTIDCLRFNVVSGESQALKVCRSPDLHVDCSGAWLV